VRASLQMLAHLLDLQDAILRVQKEILQYRGRDLHEAKVAALVPLVVEADAVYQITLHHMFMICERIDDLDKFCGLLERFNNQYTPLRQFYDLARQIKYVTDLVTVPTLAAGGQAFQATGTLAHLVPQVEEPKQVIPLMLEADEEFDEIAAAKARVRLRAHANTLLRDGVMLSDTIYPQQNAAAAPSTMDAAATTAAYAPNAPPPVPRPSSLVESSGTASPGPSTTSTSSSAPASAPRSAPLYPEIQDDLASARVTAHQQAQVYQVSLVKRPSTSSNHASDSPSLVART